MDSRRRNNRANLVASANRSSRRGRVTGPTRNQNNRPSQYVSNQRTPRPTASKRQRSTSRYNRGQNNASKRPKVEYDNDASDELCDDCKSIDWTAIDTWLDFEGIMTWRGKCVWPVGKRFRYTRADDPCPLCRQLRAPWIDDFLREQGRTQLKDRDITDEIHIFRNVRLSPMVNDFPEARKLMREHNAPFHIAVVPSCGGWKRELGTHIAENGMITVLRAGQSVRTEIFAPQQVPKMFSPKLVKLWLKKCCGHQEKCESQPLTIEGVKLIDCRGAFPKLRAYQPKDQYVALSYVWGPEARSESSKVAGQDVKPSGSQLIPSLRTLQSFSHNIPSPPRLLNNGKASASRVSRTIAGVRPKPVPISTPLPRNLPKTVRDAMKVTRALGYDYLWVDLYCIDQHNEAEKREQCSQMDKIYSGAQLTIVALGKNSEAGLPGVTSPRRNWKRQDMSIGKYTFINTLPDPHCTIEDSYWAERAWTYQEGLFSTRCLFFSHYQLYYECNAMNCTESFASNLKHLHILSGKRFRSFHRRGKFNCGNSNPWSHLDVKHSKANHRRVDIIRACQQHIYEFTKRQMTFKTDVLNAYAGIAHYYANTGARIYHLAGLPIPSPMTEQTRYEAVEYLNHLSYALSWTHMSRRGITDDVPPPEPRPGFPSWSWAGWEGEISERGDLCFFWTSTLRAVRIGYANGDIRDYTEFHGRQPQKQWLRFKLPTAKKLFFDAPVINPTKIEFWRQDPSRPRIWVPSWRTGVYMSAGRDDIDDVYQSLVVGRYQLVCIGIHGMPRADLLTAVYSVDRKGQKYKNRRIELQKSKERRALFCLVLRTMNGVSRRVGLIKVYLEDEEEIEEWDLSVRRSFEVV